ncbi:MAG TPA: cob(I)yrinic acid a,c-diamide adenosyltransferase [Ignavibacteriaceae bacterium]|nr:cob(I)yrinic acid a,c-diamide adenosyltransferase [Ignavibacteriaceae bacterium]
MKIYTKGGDKGETGLFGGDRVLKSSERIEAYGTIDELNSFIGLAITEAKSGEIKELLKVIQNQLFTVGSDLATPVNEKNKKYDIPRVEKSFFKNAEDKIDKFDAQLDPLQNFILPGGTKSAALLNICRTVCRRAERRVVALNTSTEINENIIIFLNRLSDLFFVLSRYENMISGIPDVIWKK